MLWLGIESNIQFTMTLPRQLVGLTQSDSLPPIFDLYEQRGHCTIHMACHDLDKECPRLRPTQEATYLHDMRFRLC